jgi:hypothetical protein
MQFHLVVGTIIAPIYIPSIIYITRRLFTLVQNGRARKGLRYADVQTLPTLISCGPRKSTLKRLKTDANKSASETDRRKREKMTQAMVVNDHYQVKQTNIALKKKVLEELVLADNALARRHEEQQPVLRHYSRCVKCHIRDGVGPKAGQEQLSGRCRVSTYTYVFTTDTTEYVQVFLTN